MYYAYMERKSFMWVQFIFISLLSIFLVSCGNGSTSSSTPLKEKQSLLLTYDFSESVQGFSIDTADHYVEHELNNLIISKLVQLPSPYEYRQGIYFAWINYSDDMKGFIKKKVSGLKSDSQFQVDFQVNVLSSVSEYCGGVGGSPGSSVRVKAALLLEEPIKRIESYYIYDVLYQDYVISIDDGQSGGDDVVLLGNIGLPIECTQEFIDNPVWEIKPLTNNSNFIFTSDSDGEAWVYVSIDSGSEGPSAFFLTEVEFHIQEL